MRFESSKSNMQSLSLTFVFGLRASAKRATSDVGTKSASMPMGSPRRRSSRLVPPYRSSMASTWSPGRSSCSTAVVPASPDAHTRACSSKHSVKAAKNSVKRWLSHFQTEITPAPTNTQTHKHTQTHTNTHAHLLAHPWTQRHTLFAVANGSKRLLKRVAGRVPATGILETSLGHARVWLLEGGGEGDGRAHCPGGPLLWLLASVDGRCGKLAVILRHDARFRA